MIFRRIFKLDGSFFDCDSQFRYRRAFSRALVSVSSRWYFKLDYCDCVVNSCEYYSHTIRILFAIVLKLNSPCSTNMTPNLIFSLNSAPYMFPHPTMPMCGILSDLILRDTGADYNTSQYRRRADQE